MIRNILKKHKTVVKIFSKLQNIYFCILTIISPRLNTIARYRAVYGRKINLGSPKTFHEKLLWLKLNRYINNPLVIMCADKYKVREYVKQVGCDEILNELISVYDNVKDIKWDELPDKFVLKWNFGAGMNIICENKLQLNEADVVKQLRKWKKKKSWLSHSEMHYKYISPKIICEKFLEEENNDGLDDYKVYCFHGKPRAILVMQDRKNDLKAEFFDTDWKKLDGNSKYSKLENEILKPLCLGEMLMYAERLSEGFPFVRCDFYIVNNRVIFGELTFSPAGGLYTAETKVDGKEMSDFIDIHQC